MDSSSSRFTEHTSITIHDFFQSITINLLGAWGELQSSTWIRSVRNGTKTVQKLKIYCRFGYTYLRS